MTRVEYWKMQPEEIISRFLQIAEKLVEKNSLQKIRPTPVQVFQHEMYVKFIYHLASILTLEQGSVFSRTDITKRAYDYSSVMVLFRSALETFLTYFYLYCDAKNEDEITFRFYNWYIDGLNFRQSVNVSFSSELQEKKKQERIEIANLIEVIRGTATFGALSDKQKKVVVEKCQWIRPHWADILVSTGVGQYWAKKFYAMYSAYAHTNSLSIIQFKDATARNEGKQLSSSFANLVHIAAAMFAHCFIRNFELTDTIDVTENEMIEAWMWLAKYLDREPT
ncbi:MAG: hypothetical protein JW764_02130 [Chlorobiaceae bacterium]|nr:hypothetical protein [Chlorobiaceae bacterium]